MKRTISFCSIMAFAGIALVAALPAGSARAADKKLTIAVVPKALDNAIFLDAKDAAEKRGKELGVNIVWVGSAKSDAAEQVSVLEGLIQKKVDGILVSCNDADALKDVIDRAMDQGIKVATFDSDSPKSKRLFYAGTDNYGIGKKAAEHMKKLLPAGGKVAVLTGVLGAPNLEQRIVGFRDGVKGTKITILPVQTGEDDVQKSVEVVNQFTAANKDLAGWFFDGGWPYFADPEALKEVKTFMSKGGKIVSIDTFQPMLKYVKMDMVNLLIGQNYTAMGTIGIEELVKAIKGQKLTRGAIINTGDETVDKSNVDAVLKTKKPW
jgi:ribose transport system substrate-binding protein